MGWFSKKSDSFEYVDKVWKTEEQSWRGLGREALLSLKENRQPVIISFFPKDRKRMEDYLSKVHVPLEVLEHGQTFSRRPNVIYSCLAEDLHSSALMSFLEQCHLQPGLSVFVPAHYPIIASENKMLEKLNHLAAGKVVPVFCIHLQSLLLKQFSTENLTALMEKLGMKDDECIQHALVTKSIIRVREKLAQDVIVEKTASSEEEWFHKNLPAPLPS